MIPGGRMGLVSAGEGDSNINIGIYKKKIVKIFLSIRISLEKL